MFTEDDDKEACPEFPPRSFLKTSGNNDESKNVSSDDFLSLLKPSSSSEDDVEEICGPQLPSRL